MEFTEIPYRPPQEAKSLLLRATQSCTYNKCNFCYTSRGYDFMAASPERMENELRLKRASHPPDTRVYMIGANPLVLPMATLRAYIELLRKYFPAFSELSMQAMVRDVKHKSPQELKELRAAGLSHLYIGTENGNTEALRLMNKGHTPQEAVEQLSRLHEADIHYTTQYILGMAGRGQGKKSAEDSAAFFNQAHPRSLTTTGLTVFPGTPLAEMVRRGEFTEATEKEKIEELLHFLELLTTDTFFDSRHYLNPLNYWFSTLSAGKSETIADIKDFLDTHSEAEIEEIVNRRAMLSL